MPVTKCEELHQELQDRHFKWSQKEEARWKPVDKEKLPSLLRALNKLPVAADGYETFTDKRTSYDKRTFPFLREYEQLRVNIWGIPGHSSEYNFLVRHNGPHYSYKSWDILPDVTETLVSGSCRPFLRITNKSVGPYIRYILDMTYEKISGPLADIIGPYSYRVRETLEEIPLYKPRKAAYNKLVKWVRPMEVTKTPDGFTAVLTALHYKDILRMEVTVGRDGVVTIKKKKSVARGIYEIEPILMY
jgi:hypothetical protein